MSQNALKDTIRKGAYTDLHKNIRDAFNEYGVQILSPNYVTDPEGPKFVPKERWYAAPAKPPDDPEKVI